MTEREAEIRKNVEETRKGTDSSRYDRSGVTRERTQINSKNLDKLLEQRGLSPEERKIVKESMDPEAKMYARHAKAGEKYVTTHGQNRPSGIYVSEKSLGKTAGERIDKGALPHTNTAEFETKVELTKDQTVVEGKIAPQSKFSKMDPAQRPRSGGGLQVVTDGGYRSGAIINRDPKYPIPSEQSATAQASRFGAHVSRGGDAGQGAQIGGTFARSVSQTSGGEKGPSGGSSGGEGKGPSGGEGKGQSR